MNPLLHQSVAQSGQKGAEPGLRRAIDIVRRSASFAGNRADPHKRAGPALGKPVGEFGQNACRAFEIRPKDSDECSGFPFVDFLFAHVTDQADAEP